MTKFASHCVSWLSLVSALCVAQAAFAGLLRLESETLTSLHNDDGLKARSSNYEFLGANYMTDARDFEMNSDFGVSDDLTYGHATFDLYLLNASYKLIPDRLSVYAGRNFDVQHTGRAAFMDSVGVDYWLWQKRFKIGTFAGRERKVELKEDGPTASVTGLYGQYQSSSFFPAVVKGTFMYRQFPRTPDKPEYLAKLSANKSFAGNWSPEVLFDSEENVRTGNLNRLETGFDLYPTTNSAFRWRALTYDAKPEDGIEQPIFSIFSQGRLYETSAQVERRLSRQVVGSLSLGYDNYLLNRDLSDRVDGVKSEADIQWSRETFSFENSLYYLKSFGGNAYGDRIWLGQKLSDRLQLNGGIEVTHYDKVTSATRFAFNSMAGATWGMMDHYKLSTVAEFNSNNILNYEWRAMAKLVYVLWAER